MKPTITYLFSSCAIALFLPLSGCTYVGEKYYTQHLKEVGNSERDPKAIAGDWIGFGFMELSSRQAVWKNYFRLKPDGTGTIRMVLKESSQGNKGEMENDLKWSYLGHNTWKLSPAGRQSIRTITPMPPRWEFMRPYTTPLVVRFHEGRLYCTTWKQTYIRFGDEAAMRQKRDEDKAHFDESFSFVKLGL